MAGISSLTRLFVYASCATIFGAALAIPLQAKAAVSLASHKALYAIQIKTVRTGSDVVDVQGKILSEVKKSCDGWIANNKLNLTYNYSEDPPIQVETKMTSFEGFDGKTLNFSSIRTNNGELDRELRGTAKISTTGQGKVQFSIPDSLSFKLSENTFFPEAHIAKLIEIAQSGQRIFNAHVFDGSDDKGPVEINVVIGRKTCGASKDPLLSGCGWALREAVFHDTGDNQSISDYEMSMDLLENGVVKSMTADYHSFSVTQKLIAIEKVNEECGVE